jgi:hypothetical protein
MKPYGDPGGSSGVVAYDAGPDFIRVAFRNGSVYLYTYASAGAANIEHMKHLAQSNRGLTTFINTRVWNRYVHREH